MLSFLTCILLKEKDGSDSLAVQLADEKHWDDLVIIIAVVCSFSHFSYDIINIIDHHVFTYKRGQNKLFTNWTQWSDFLFLQFLLEFWFRSPQFKVPWGLYNR